MIPEQLNEVINYYPNSPLIQLDDPWLMQFNVDVFVKRDDLIDRRISGNKFRKLKYALCRYHNSSYSGVISFGGPWSNHLHAFSSVTENYNIPAVAIVRGERPNNPSSTLLEVEASGTKVHYVCRTDYRLFRELAKDNSLQEHPFFKQWPNFMIIPEGGCSDDAMMGVADIVDEIAAVALKNFKAIYLACGTGATLAGMSLGLTNNPDTRLVGVAALKAGESLNQNVQRLLKEHGKPHSGNWQIEDTFHFGGFAKTTEQLFEFMRAIYQRTGLITEPVYTGKSLFALYQHIQEGRFPPGSQLMLLHTGGLQGLRGFRGKGLEPLIQAAGY